MKTLMQAATPRTIVVLGAVVAMAGCFCPVIHLPIVGSMTYLQNASGDGFWVAGISAVALVSAAFGFSAGGIIGGAIIAFLLFRVQGLMNEGLDRMHALAAGAGALSGLADAMANAVYLEYGFYIVVGGGALMLLGGIASLFSWRSRLLHAQVTDRESHRLPVASSTKGDCR